MLDETLEQQGLTIGDWKVLSALRWPGEPLPPLRGRARPHRGADERHDDDAARPARERGPRAPPPRPDDRRSVIVELTAKGRKKHDEAMGVQAEKEKLLAAALSAREMEQLNSLLRRVMIKLQERVPRKHD